MLIIIVFFIREKGNIHSHFATVFLELKHFTENYNLLDFSCEKVQTCEFHFQAVIVPSASKRHLRTR